MCDKQPETIGPILAYAEALTSTSNEAIESRLDRIADALDTLIDIECAKAGIDCDCCDCNTITIEGPDGIRAEFVVSPEKADAIIELLMVPEDIE